jgi:hypothetical protein
MEDKIDSTNVAVQAIVDIDVQQRSASSERQNELTIDGIIYLATELHRVKPYSPEAALAQLAAALEGNFRGPLATARLTTTDDIPRDAECVILMPEDSPAQLIWQNFKNVVSFGQRRFGLSPPITDYLRESVVKCPRTRLIEKHDRPDHVLADALGFTVNDFRRAAALHSAGMSTEDRVQRAEMALHTAQTRLHQYVCPDAADFAEQKARIDEFIATQANIKRRNSKKRKSAESLDEEAHSVDDHATRQRMQAIKVQIEALQREYESLETKLTC